MMEECASAERGELLNGHYNSHFGGVFLGYGATLWLSLMVAMVAGKLLEQLCASPTWWALLSVPLTLPVWAYLTVRHRGWPRLYRWIGPTKVAVRGLVVWWLPLTRPLEHWEVESSRVIRRVSFTSCVYEFELRLTDGRTRRVRTMVDGTSLQQLRKLGL